MALCHTWRLAVLMKDLLWYACLLCCLFYSTIMLENVVSAPYVAIFRYVEYEVYDNSVIFRYVEYEVYDHYSITCAYWVICAYYRWCFVYAYWVICACLYVDVLCLLTELSVPIICCFFAYVYLVTCVYHMLLFCVCLYCYLCLLYVDVWPMFCVCLLYLLAERLNGHIDTDNK